MPSVAVYRQAAQRGQVGSGGCRWYELLAKSDVGKQFEE